ncbi:MAG: 1,6-anhydro-N-acetylmuramyl-L-alanine amidase AmpD [Gammaproteobacteria bacterium]|nr:1,6-anhydro-N-acetylmuramyl-L-alanine amidase AmpD [Gammaproteobacteria bacterium]
MNIDRNHRIESVRRVDSPNCDQRPYGERLSLIVIHAISLPPGSFGGPHIENLFTNCLDFEAHTSFESLKGLHVSSHLVIARDGNVTQYVPFNLRAWHAGESQYRNRSDCNNFSIGIELEGTGEVRFTDAQYGILSEILRCLLDHYPTISRDSIVGHSEISRGRKWDPGLQFDWKRVMRSVV